MPLVYQLFWRLCNMNHNILLKCSALAHKTTWYRVFFFWKIAQSNFPFNIHFSFSTDVLILKIVHFSTYYVFIFIQLYQLIVHDLFPFKGIRLEAHSFFFLPLLFCYNLFLWVLLFMLPQSVSQIIKEKYVFYKFLVFCLFIQKWLHSKDIQIPYFSIVYFCFCFFQIKMSVLLC